MQPLAECLVNQWQFQGLKLTEHDTEWIVPIPVQWYGFQIKFAMFGKGAHEL